MGTKKDVAPEEEEQKGKSSDNVFTGESIAVKSNQLMYLIPPECIGVENATGKSLFCKNPLTSAEYAEIQEKIANDPTAYTEVSLDVEVEKLNSTLTDYIAKEGGLAKPEKVFVQTTEKPLVYYYMKFDNEESANRYFALYYNSNKETYDDYIKSYVTALDFPSTATVTRIKLAANGIYGDETQGYNLLPNTVDGASTQLADNQLRYQEKFAALCTMLTDNYLEIAGAPMAPDKSGQILFENLVDETMLETYIQAGSATDTLLMTDTYGDVILTKSDYVITDSDVHLVIAGGDVTIDIPNFEGTVFANGKVTVTGTVQSIKTDTEAVNAMLRYAQEVDGKKAMVAQVLRAGKEFVFAAEDLGESEDAVTSMADLIVYENWKKE